MENIVLENRYELIEKIGGGGMAYVYKAKCTFLNRLVAVKILRTEFTNDEEFVKRFIVEAQSAASLSHRNIISIYDVGHQENTHYIVMEYSDGVTLKDYIIKEAPLNWEEAINISIQICSALEHSHKNNIIHRDIKPHNIMIAKDGVAKVADFGIAKAVSSSTLTIDGSAIGSVHYFSPEQARGGHTDERSDIYSLGITLYEMVTGQMPFDGATPVEIALKHMHEEAKPAISVNSSIPKGVNDIINKAIQKDQDKRFQTAQEMLESLNNVLKDSSGKLEVIKDDDFVTKKIPIIYEKLTTKGDWVMKNDTECTKKKGGLSIWLASVISILLISTVAFITIKVVMPPIYYSSKDITVGNYIGKQINEVKNVFDDAKITINITEVNNESSAGTILMQDVEPGKTLRVSGYNTISFSVSLGEKYILIPNMDNKDYKMAAIDLTNLGVVPVIEEESSESVVNDLVIRTSPSGGEEVIVGSTVTIFRSKEFK